MCRVVITIRLTNKLHLYGLKIIILFYIYYCGLKVNMSRNIVVPNRDGDGGHHMHFLSDGRARVLVLIELTNQTF